MDADTMKSVWDCLLGVVLCPLVIPWRFVWQRYVRERGERWR
jgi:RNAse (barnase) inhibitor barstar